MSTEEKDRRRSLLEEIERLHDTLGVLRSERAKVVEYAKEIAGFSLSRYARGTAAHILELLGETVPEPSEAASRNILEAAP